MKVAVIGLGYVGLPLAAVLANTEGVEVTGIQRRSARSGWKIAALNRGDATVNGIEPEVGRMVSEAVEKGTLRASDNFSEVGEADVVAITVQTPIDERRKPVLSHLEDACIDIGVNMSAGSLICLESTVPPGTTEYFVKPILEEESGLKAGKEFSLVHSYERVTPGRLIFNLVNLPRVVGGYTDRCTERGVEFYSSFSKGGVTGVDCLTAEVSKLVENSHRDVNIALANELSKICGSLGVDYYKVKGLINALPDIEGASNPVRNLLDPGAGVGGHCLPKDSHLLMYGTGRFGSTRVASKLLRTAREINDSMPGLMLGLIEDAMDEADRPLVDSKVALLGLAYREDTDDCRNSPTLSLLKWLRSEVAVHDPYVLGHPEVKVRPLLDTIIGSDCLVVMTRHSAYKELELQCIASMMRTRVIVDGRNLFEPSECIDEGFVYRGIGHAVN